MKKILIFLISFIVLGLSVYAQAPEENFQKAAKTEFAQREKALKSLKSQIENYFDRMVGEEDYDISIKEMKKLKKDVKSFDRRKKQYDKALSVFGLMTSSNLKPVIRKHVKIFFRTFVYRDNEKQEIRIYRIIQIGHDVRVEMGFHAAPVLRSLIATFIIAILAVVGFYYFGNNTFKYSLTLGIVIMIVLFILTLSSTIN